MWVRRCWFLAQRQEGEDGPEKPLAFISRLLNKAERNYNICELELLSVVWSLKKLRTITWGCKIIVFSDNSALSYLMKKRYLTGRIARWILSILEDDVEIRYRSGKLQEHIDCLIQYPVGEPEEEEMETRAVMEITFGREREPVHLAQEGDDPTGPLFVEGGLSSTLVGDSQTSKVETHSKGAFPVDHVTRTSEWGSPLGKGEEKRSLALHDSAMAADEEKRLLAEEESMMAAEEKRNVFLPPPPSTPVEQLQSEGSDINLAPENAELWSEIKRLQREEKPWGNVIVELEKGKREMIRNYFLHDGFLRKAIMRNGLTYDRLCLPETYRARILAIFHDEMVSGAYLGITRIYDRISKRFYWVGLQTDVIEYVGSCPHCQSRKRSYAPPAGKMVCVRVEKPFDRCVCDLLGPFPPSPDNKRFVIVLIDSLTKFCETEAIATANAVDTAEFFVKKVLLRHGQIKTLQTDNGTHYV